MRKKSSSTPKLDFFIDIIPKFLAVSAILGASIGIFVSAYLSSIKSPKKEKSPTTTVPSKEDMMNLNQKNKLRNY